MPQFTSPLNNLKIASPCKADWESMIGSNRKRYCGDCKLNVYNLSGMTRHEAENVLVQSEGRVCVRYFQRSDGTVLTKDCPVGWEAARMKMKKFWTASVSLLFTLFGGIGLTSYLTQTERMGGITGKPMISNESTMGTVPVDHGQMGQPLMGNVAVEVEGRVSNIDEIKGEILRDSGN